MSNADLNVAKKLELTGVNQNWRYISQVEIDLDWLYHRISIPVIFIRDSQRVSNNEELGRYMSFRQNTDLE